MCSGVPARPLKSFNKRTKLYLSTYTDSLTHRFSRRTRLTWKDSVLFGLSKDFAVWKASAMSASAPTVKFPLSGPRKRKYPSQSACLLCTTTWLRWCTSQLTTYNGALLTSMRQVWILSQTQSACLSIWQRTKSNLQVIRELPSGRPSTKKTALSPQRRETL